jgi:DNA ligase 1
MHNDNVATVDERGYTKRSSHQENKVGTDTLGALVVKGVNGPFEGVEFNIGTGFDDRLRKEIWSKRDYYLRSIVKYKFFAVGVKDAPRHPVFLGFRNAMDVAA